jgi:ADP-ribose pyrophosphatase
MAQKRGEWTILSSKQIYEHETLKLCEDEVIKPNGERGEHATVQFQPGIEVLVVDDALDAYFAKEFRYAIGREDLEAVGGSLKEDELPKAAARIKRGTWHRGERVH